MNRLTLEQHYEIIQIYFENQALEQLANDPLFYRKIVFSDEGHFWLNGFVN